MPDKEPPTKSQLSLEQIARRIRERRKRMDELGAEHVRLSADYVRLAMAIGEDLLAGRGQFTSHGTWLSWLREACELQQRQALRYVALAEHRAAVEAYLTRESNSGAKASIRGALDFISPREKKPKTPKLTEVETPAALGLFLNEHPDLFWQALQLAPKLKDEIAQRLLPKATTVLAETSKATAEVVTDLHAILKLSGQRSESNLETIRDKATHALRLFDPGSAAKSVSVVSSNVHLDRDALSKALGLDHSDHDAMPAGTAIH
jgi:hypothetical protein